MEPVRVWVDGEWFFFIETTEKNVVYNEVEK